MFDYRRRVRRRGLIATIADLTERIEELEDDMSVVEGRSRLNAERIVRTHSSLQNVAEDFKDFEQIVDSQSGCTNDR